MSAAAGHSPSHGHCGHRGRREGGGAHPAALTPAGALGTAPAPGRGAEWQRPGLPCPPGVASPVPSTHAAAGTGQVAQRRETQDLQPGGRLGP